MTEARVVRLLRLAAINAGQPIIPETVEEVAEFEKYMERHPDEFPPPPESLSAANVWRRIQEARNAPGD